MKYKLIKYDENKIKGYLNIQGIFDLYNIMENKLVDNHLKYYNMIKSNEDYYILYQNLISKITYIVDNNRKSIELNKNNKLNQRGGQPILYLPLIFSGVASSFIVTSVVAYILFRILTAPRCRPKYPSTINDSYTPQYKDIIVKFLPSTLISNYFPNYKDYNEEELYLSINNYLDIFSKILNLISPDSILGQIATKTLDIIGGIAVTSATIISLGGAAVINYIYKIFNLIKDAIVFLLSFVKAFQEIIKILTSRISRKFIYDLFLIDFTDGPFGVKCWVEYILDNYKNKYGESFNIIKDICIKFNIIFNKVYREFISFITRTITFSLPEGGVSAVLISTITSISEVIKCRTYDIIIIRLNKAYEKMSYDNQILFEKPDLMKKNLDNYLLKGKPYFKFIDEKFKGIGDSISKFYKYDSNIRTNISPNSMNNGDYNTYNFLLSNTELLSFVIHKVFAIIYTILYILSYCAKEGYC